MIFLQTSLLLHVEIQVLAKGGDREAMSFPVPNRFFILNTA